jgi:pentatricopeptide repeat protein
VISYSAAISACEKAGKHQSALDLLKEMDTKGIQPNVISYSAAISACEKAGKHQSALDLLREMDTKGIQPDVISYSAAISACEKAGKHQSALDLLREMDTKGIQPDVISYSAAISACEKAGKHQSALDLLKEMDTKGIQPNVISYSAAISACEKAGKHQSALDLLKEMDTKGIQPNVISYSSVLECLFALKDYEQIFRIIDKAHKVKCLPQFTVSYPIWDLHGLTLAVCCSLVLYSLLATDSENDKLSSDIILVTGKGKGSGPEGPVLKVGATIFFKNEFDLQLEPVQGNAGVLLLTQSVAKECQSKLRKKLLKLPPDTRKNSCY